MPSKSRAQHNYMEMIAHGGKPRGKKGPSVKVAKEFVAADKGRSLKSMPTKVGPKKPKVKYGPGPGTDGNPLNDDGLGSTVLGRRASLKRALARKRK